MKREPRLQFSDADLAEPKLEKPIKRVKKAAAKADKAQAKIPKKTVVKKERGFDPATGKVKTQLRFEEVDKKKPPSKLTHAVQDAPANFVLSQVHREVRQSESDRKNCWITTSHTKAAQRWAVSPIGRGSIKYLWLECAEALTKTANVQV